MVYSPEFKRDIPEGWRIVDIKTVCQVVDCLHSKKPEYCFETEKSYLLTLENLTHDGYVDLKEKFYISVSDYAVWTRNIEVMENDFTITNAGRAGDICMVPRGVKCAAGRNMTIVRPVSITPYYLKGYFGSGYMDMQIKANLEPGALFMNFNVHSIKKIKVLLPSEGCISRTTSVLEKITVNIENAREQISHLVHLRDFLLPLLMNGQVQIGQSLT